MNRNPSKGVRKRKSDALVPRKSHLPLLNLLQGKHNLIAADNNCKQLYKDFVGI